MDANATGRFIAELRKQKGVHTKGISRKTYGNRQSNFSMGNRKRAS